MTYEGMEVSGHAVYRAKNGKYWIGDVWKVGSDVVLVFRVHFYFDSKERAEEGLAESFRKDSVSRALLEKHT